MQTAQMLYQLTKNTSPLNEEVFPVTGMLYTQIKITSSSNEEEIILEENTSLLNEEVIQMTQNTSSRREEVNCNDKKRFYKQYI